jgi:hypothetical protein
MWYKAEAYWGSEYAGKVLYDNGLTPIYVSDNPVLNAQHVLFEAAKGYRYGLPYHAALAAVTSAPAERLGFGQRLGKIKPGFDADIVVWDSDPLSVGATPVQVWIDGTAQFDNPVKLKKPAPKPIIPDESLFETPKEPVVMDEVVFTGVSKVIFRAASENLAPQANNRTVVVSKGRVVCIGDCKTELQTAVRSNTPIINLKNGYFTESLTAFGSTIGLNAIDAERDTDNGPNPDSFTRAEDGLIVDNKKLRVAHSYGVTKAISAPKYTDAGGYHGTSVGFLTGVKTALDKDAIFAGDAAVHYTLDVSATGADGPNTPSSMSAAIGTLRRKLLTAASTLNDTTGEGYSEPLFLRKVVNGSLPLVINVHSADTIAALLKVKSAVDDVTGSKIRLVILGGAESYLLADELASANVGVVLAPLQSYAKSWDQRRALTGAPLTNGTCVDRLLDAGVLTAIGLEEDWLVRDLGLLAGIVFANGEGRVDERGALEMVGGNLYKMLGLEEPGVDKGHFVIWEGSPLEINGRVKAVGGGIGNRVTVF